jgi:hypothetical protein
MGRFTEYFRHAFAIEPDEPQLYAEVEIPPERKKALIEKLAKEIVERRLAVPAIMFLETVKPLSFLGSQALIFIEPIVQSIFSFRSYRELTLMMENRENVELLMQEIEQRERER